ncbi:hypothetical protein [Afipia felis]|uniref:GIY-YIG domain-containing protein n=2 Tax=Afipia felis TaxID=1035 RepID=A0A380WAH1_AFIFE|nr:hypothetical protein [Afipia felis]EKS29202.1 hypothetical protein HMPREF9697_01730 [Afipia felis ATCC 53690]SUU77909.1 Uncharacterised protein [Afipia felis]SUU85974.1 Uncharacterised protein [Afipia felis]
MSSVCQPAFDAGTTTIIHRPKSGITGFRDIIDEASRLSVCAFPFAPVDEELRNRLSWLPACYILSNGREIYVGETGNMARRLGEHLADPDKSFANEVFVVSGLAHRWYDKSGPMFLQERLTRLAEAAGFVTVRKDKNPPQTEPTSWHRTTLERIVTDGERLLFDAGCRAFHSNNTKPVASLMPALVPSYTLDDEDDENCLMQIGVSTAPIGSQEYELNYCGIWARGYPLGDNFVVAAGSEVRSTINPSARPIVKTRHEALRDAAALAPITGVEDRLRLTVAVAFHSLNTAAQVVCGAQATARLWQRLSHASPIIVAA